MKTRLDTPWRSRITWAVATVLVLVLEFVGLLTPVVDPLSRVVIDGIDAHPETFGAGVLLGLCWLIYHWFIVPVWRVTRKRLGGKQ